MLTKAKAGKRTSLIPGEIRNEIIELGAYNALFGFDTGLWKEAANCFIGILIKLEEKK